MRLRIPRGWRARHGLLVAVSTATTLLVVCGTVVVARDSDHRPYRRGPIVILTGATKGTYFSYGVELAAAINRRLDGVQATTDATTESVENVGEVAASPNVFAFAAADAASAGVDGRAPFAAPQPIRALARIYDDYLHLVVRAKSPIHDITDLPGRRVSVGSAGSGTELIANRMLDVTHVDPGTLTVSHLGINESMAALAAGGIDAFFWSGGLPTDGISDLATRVAVRLVPLAGLAAPLRDQWDHAYRPGAIPAGTYPLADGADDTPTVAIPDLLITRTDTDPGLVEEVTRVLFEARATIAATVPAADALDRRSAIATSPIPLHDGALRYYRSVKT